MKVSSIRFYLLASAFGLANILSTAYAEEGASGHYLPGSLASTIDMIPADTTFVARLSFSHYNGALKNSGLEVPIAGLIATEVDVEFEEFALHLVWNPGWEITNGWSYAMAATLPYVSTTITANVVHDLFAEDGAPRKATDKSSGLGDLILQPLLLSHRVAKYWQGDFRFAIYAPTGSFEVGRLANVGKNYWTFSPTLALNHIEPAIGREFSVFGGFDINTKNTDTDYHTGIQTHIESTFVQYVILLGGFSGLGLSGYWYQQLTGDSGAGATLGDFKSQAVGVGPVLSYKTQWGNTDISSELKWLHEFETKRRAEGDSIFFKILARF